MNTQHYDFSLIKFKKTRLLAATTAIVSCIALSVVHAQTTQEKTSATSSIHGQDTRDFDIKPAELAKVLNQFADQTGLQLIYDADFLKGMKSSGLKGKYTAVQGLYALLIDTGYHFDFKGQNMVIIQKTTLGKNEEAIMLNPSIVLAERPRGVVIDPSSSGRAIIGRGALSSLNQGKGDPMDAFTQLPNVMFSSKQYKVDENTEQSLLPQEISISGGDIDSNLITFDGLQTKSYIYDSENDNPASLSSLGISTTHMIILDADLLEQVAVQDSNISAKYTGFSGGVIELKTREPKKEFGGSISGKYQTDSLTNYIETLEDDEGKKIEIDSVKYPKPQFEKFKIGLNLDIPINEKLSSLVAFSLRQSKVSRSISDDYSPLQGDFVKTKSRSIQFLGKLMYNISNEDTLIFSTNITPYESGFVLGNVYNNEQNTKGTSHVSSLEWRKESNLFSAKVKTYYSGSGFKRDAVNELHRLYNFEAGIEAPNKESFTNVCNRSSCTVGGWGDIENRQNSFGVDADFSYDLSVGELNFGLRWNNTNVHAERFDLHFANSRGLLKQSSRYNILCADSTDKFCIPGEQVVRERQVRYPYDIKVGMNVLDGYVEFKGEQEQEGFIQKIRYRFGVAATYEDYLKNFNFAPRLTVGVDFADYWSFDLGANKYYTRNFLGYALKDGRPHSISEYRVFNKDGKNYTFENDWILYNEFKTTKYEDADLKTPHSRELTAALTFSDQATVGTFRLKGIYRKNIDRISRRLTEKMLTRTYKGKEKTYTQRMYSPENLGESNYKGLSAEWNKSLDNHFFSLTATWSKSKSSNLNYYRSVEETDVTVSYIEDLEKAKKYNELEDSEFVKTFTTLEELSIRQSEFSVPWQFTAFWKAHWFDKKLTTSIDGKYVPKWMAIQQIRKNRKYDGERYYIYSLLEQKNLLRFNADVSYKIEIASERFVTLNLHVNNIFNSSSRTAVTRRPYEKGRSVILGVKASF